MAWCHSSLWFVRAGGHEMLYQMFWMPQNPWLHNASGWDGGRSTGRAGSIFCRTADNSGNLDVPALKGSFLRDGLWDTNVIPSQQRFVGCLWKFTPRIKTHLKWKEEMEWMTRNVSVQAQDLWKRGVKKTGRKDFLSTWRVTCRTTSRTHGYNVWPRSDSTKSLALTFALHARSCQS